MRTKYLAMIITAALVAGACSGSGGGDSADGPLPTTSIVQEAAEGDEPDQRIALNEQGVSLRLGTLTERAIDIDADGRNTTAAIEGMNAFSVDLYSNVAAAEASNVIISPYSVAFALSMIYAGANGETAAEMASMMHVPDAIDWHEGINAYDLSLDARTTGSPTQWNSANKVWTANGMALLTEYLDVLTGDYGSPVASADFAANADAERITINDWISDETNELIPELFPSGSIDASTAMVLVNAIALDAPWEFPFDPAGTSQAPFTLADGSAVDVPMMHYDEFLPTGFGEEYQAVEIPYGGGALSMVVIVPNDLAEFEANLSADRLSSIVGGISDGGIHLSIPKWTSRTTLTLNDNLKALGMTSAFGAGADFSNMTGTQGLWLDRVEHQAFIEVDENGTRAAAATGGVMLGSHGPTIEVNRPYLYLIRDKNAGTILFIGRVLDPTETP